MQLPLYTTETANWYALINRAQAESNSYFQRDVEDYLVYLLAYMETELSYVENKSIEADGINNVLPDLSCNLAGL